MGAGWIGVRANASVVHGDTPNQNAENSGDGSSLMDSIPIIPIRGVCMLRAKGRCARLALRTAPMSWT